jgi:predicted transposase YdaD
VEAILEDKRQAREEERERAYAEKLDSARKLQLKGLEAGEIADTLNLPLDTVLAL